MNARIWRWLDSIATNNPIQINGTVPMFEHLGFGSLSISADYKSEVGFVGVPFTDLMFTDGILYAVYENVGDGSQSF